MVLSLTTKSVNMSQPAAGIGNKPTVASRKHQPTSKGNTIGRRHHNHTRLKHVQALYHGQLQATLHHCQLQALYHNGCVHCAATSNRRRARTSYRQITTYIQLQTLYYGQTQAMINHSQLQALPLPVPSQCLSQSQALCHSQLPASTLSRSFPSILTHSATLCHRQLQILHHIMY